MSDNASPVKTTPTKNRNSSSSRVAQLSKRFNSTNDTPKVALDPTSPEDRPSMTRSATAKRVLDHEVKMWLELNVTASRDF